jgi:hypothetical protein
MSTTALMASGDVSISRYSTPQFWDVVQSGVKTVFFSLVTLIKSIWFVITPGTNHIIKSGKISGSHIWRVHNEFKYGHHHKI